MAVTFSILFVCTANICRSAMAEALLRAKLPADAGITVASAGTQPLLGHDIDRAAAHAVRELGADPAGHQARPVTPQSAKDADLVLTATAAHRAAVVQLAPLAFRRVFTLREVVRLATGLADLPAGSDADARRQCVRDVAARRGVVDPPAPGTDDIGDPFGAPQAQMAACAVTIDAAVSRVLAVLGVPPALADR